VPGQARDVRPSLLRRRPSRPQLKRDPLGRPDFEHSRMRLVTFFLALLLTRPLGAQARADSLKPTRSFAAMQVVRLNNGSNAVDLDGDGRPDAVFMAWRENYNAHGYNHVTFYVSYADQYQPVRRWYLVPFFDARGSQTADSYNTGQGADCVLSDIRVLRPATSGSGPVTVITGKRDMGQSFADTAAVTFVVYELARNTDAVPGAPPMYLQARQTIRGRRAYCDINEAFQRELGVGRGPHEP